MNQRGAEQGNINTISSNVSLLPCLSLANRTSTGCTTTLVGSSHHHLEPEVPHAAPPRAHPL